MESDRAVLSNLLENASLPSTFGPDVIMVVMDTVGARFLDLYGYPFPTMPGLARHAATGRVYTHAIAESPWTLPSHASLFTGLYPSEHGADGRLLTTREKEERDEAGRWVDDGEPVRLERPLSDDAETLAERLSDAGWRTVGISANQAYLQPYWNLDQGFDVWACQQLETGASRLPYTRGDRIGAMALQAIDDPGLVLADGSRTPLFLFLNFMEAHVPYVPRKGFVRDPRALSWRYRRGHARQSLIDRVLAHQEPLPTFLQASWIQAYEAELRFLDAQIGSLIDGLEARHYFDHGYLVIVSDHGEYFGEHDLVEHSKDVYQSALWIPAMVWGPGIAPGRDETPIQLGTVHDWVLGWTLGRDGRRRGMQVSEIHGGRFRDVFSPEVGGRFDRVRRAFQVGGKKVILGSDGSFEGYDLGVDPGEERDRSGDAWAREMRWDGEKWIKEHGVAVRAGRKERKAGREVGREVMERMRGLGYVE